MPKWWRNSQEECDQIHEETLRKQAERAAEERARFQRAERFKQWEYEQEHGAPPSTPLPPTNRNGGR